MTIPQEIQDLMPERRDCDPTCPSNLSGARCTGDTCDAHDFNAALTEVEAVLPQMLALAEKRGAEGERERIRKVIEESMYNNPMGERAINRNEAFEVVLHTLTQPNHEKT